MNIELNLPDVLNPYKDKIMASAKDFIRIVPKDAVDTDWWQSKIGGLPYLPQGSSYPTEKDGRPLFLLTQLNFEEIPALPHFPKKGILQFFIADNEMYGLDFEDASNQEKFRVRYYMDIEKDETLLETDFSLLPEVENLPFKPVTSYPLDFKLQKEYIPINDHAFETLFGADFFSQFGRAEWDIQEKYSEQISSNGHKIGGYAFFTQQDPRQANQAMQLLFQLDSDDKIDVQWGDMGVANFFISEKDLKNEIFSNVLYNWDCY